ncbi:PDR/VanB family oxidoreductase [Burkholderia pseudomultivorans]|uniref:Ferredoxin n=1 Tax=Burkholderia pseudomultivorans TaxID=1207504 RepID=A0A132EI33_9BURK|nr:PDR/VanB family oxidoreductase [Burkholderia pseudomultivorans]KWF30773.1 ferredoxin [Burkholderia pseudomultivorans]
MIEVRVTAVKYEAEGIVGVELRAADASPLPPFEPGAHIDVCLPDGKTRQYSLCNDAADTSRYCLGVGRAVMSRGASAYIHDKLRVGDILTIGEPRTLFRLSPDASRHRFIAGGIGVTPILAMIRSCVRHDLPWELHYCVRSRAHAAYLDELSSFGGTVHLHADDEETAPSPRDVGAMMCNLDAREHIYCCGPAGLMDAASASGKRCGISPERIHFERFAASPGGAQRCGTSANENRSFAVVLARQGLRYTVQPDESILQCLERHGVRATFSCREGLCRSCEVALLSGEADHRDYVLTDDQQRANASLMICVSRARSSELVIDL